MPRARSSGALSIWSNLRKSGHPFHDNVFVIAAVKEVLPWSMCPIVPTFTWGFVRVNTALDILYSPSSQDRPVFTRPTISAGTAKVYSDAGTNAPSLMAQLHRRSRHG